MGRKSNLKDRILKDIENKVDVAIQATAAELSFQIENAYENVISMFYNDYEPLVYKRTYSTFLGSNGYNDPYSAENIYKNGNSWIAGIDVGHDFIPGNPYRAEKDWVFDRTFNKGVHGVNIHTVRHRNTTLLEKDKERRLLAKYFSKMNKNQKKLNLKTKGFIFHQQKFGKISVWNTSIPKNMNPSPRKLLDKEFKKMTKRQNLDRIFNDQLKNIII